MARRARGLLALPLCFAAAGLALAGCGGEQPEVCRIMLACFDPEVVPLSAQERYRGCPDDPFYQHTDDSYPNWEATERAFGEGGDCWAGGSEDPYYAACERACQELVWDDCWRGAQMGSERGDLCQATLQEAGAMCSDLEYSSDFEPRTCAE